jgi:hypothetical protein
VIGDQADKMCTQWQAQPYQKNYDNKYPKKSIDRHPQANLAGNENTKRMQPSSSCVNVLKVYVFNVYCVCKLICQLTLVSTI